MVNFSFQAKFKDCPKRHLKARDIEIDSRELKATDRLGCQSIVRGSISIIDNRLAGETAGCSRKQATRAAQVGVPEADLLPFSCRL